MKKLFFSLRKTSALFVLMLFSVLLFGCKPDAEPEVLPENVERLAADDPLIQDWFEPVYKQRTIITRNSLTTKAAPYFGPQTDENGKIIFNDGYAGNDLCVLKLSESSGTIFIKYTRAADSNWNYTTDPTQAPDIGKWYAVSYTDFNSTNKIIKFSGAMGTKSSCDTLEDVVAEFTSAKGYFGTYDEYQLYFNE